MAFGDFTFPDIQHVLGLTLEEADLFSATPIVVQRPEFLAELAEDVQLAVAVDTEKARSEFIIAPLLLELRRLLGRSFGLFSGVQLASDPDRGLNGTCDFVLTRYPRQLILSAPLVAVVEAKNDNLRSGLGQCIAATYAAQLFNQRAGTEVNRVFGVVTTGAAWRFLRLVSDTATLDTAEYPIDNPGKIMGILQEMVRR